MRAAPAGLADLPETMPVGVIDFRLGLVATPNPLLGREAENRCHGRLARKAGMGPAANPYVPDTESHWEWLCGWREEEARRGGERHSHGGG